MCVAVRPGRRVALRAHAAASVGAHVKLVLDTNVVIDWLVFNAPFLASFRKGVQGGRIVVFTHPPALAELRRVLGYRSLKLDMPRREAVIARYVALTRNPEPPEAPLPPGFPRCRDPDDDPFLALAWRSRADALVSRDERVLKLARRTVRWGFRVLGVPQMMAEIEREPCTEAR